MVGVSLETLLESVLYSNHFVLPGYISALAMVKDEIDWPILTWRLMFLPVDSTALYVLCILVVFVSKK